MCQSIYIRGEDGKISTVGEFVVRFGRDKLVWDSEDSHRRYQDASISDLQFCLCGMEVEEMARLCGYRLVAWDGAGFDPMDHTWETGEVVGRS